MEIQKITESEEAVMKELIEEVSEELSIKNKEEQIYNSKEEKVLMVCEIFINEFKKQAKRKSLRQESMIIFLVSKYVI